MMILTVATSQELFGVVPKSIANPGASTAATDSPVDDWKFKFCETGASVA
jgi:hypothetical protein